MKFINKNYILNVYRKQGAIILDITCNTEIKVLSIVEEGINIQIKSKSGKLPIKFTLQKPLPKNFKIERNLNKIGNLDLNLDLRKMMVSGIISGKYAFNEESARRDSLLNAVKMSRLYEKETRNTPEPKFTNYTHNNVARPFQGGAVNPR